MRFALLFVAACLLVLLPTSATLAKGGGAYGSFSTGTHGYRAALGVARDSHGHIARSTKAKDEFKKAQPCPSTRATSGACPGYVIDHITPLRRGGADAPVNMQWQTVDQAKIKDRTE
jgi:hypothetical protein